MKLRTISVSLLLSLYYLIIFHLWQWLLVCDRRMAVAIAELLYIEQWHFAIRISAAHYHVI